jgi:hypothetical protein
VRRIVYCHDQLRPYFYVGIGATLFALLGFASAAGLSDGVMPLVILGASVGLVIGLMCLYMGRPRGLTRLRIEGVRGSVDATIKGRLKKRTRALQELERRVLRRQSSG